MLWTNIIGGVAATLAAVYILPQAFRLFRTKDTNGVSPSTAVLLVSFSCLWIIYGFTIRNIPTISATAFAILQEIILLILLTKHKSVKAKHLILGVSIVTAGAILVALDKSELLGLSISFSTALAFLPQIVTTRKAPDTAGISPSFLVISVANGLSWLLYGILVSEIPLIVWGASATILFGINAISWLIRRIQPRKELVVQHV